MIRGERARPFAEPGKRWTVRNSSSPRIKERDVLAQCMETLRLFPTVRYWRSNTGAAWVPTLSGGRTVRFGTPGQADITGIIRPSGRRLEIEVKAPDGKQSPEQVAFEQMILDSGGLYLLVRSAQELVDSLIAAGVRPRRFTR